MAVVDGQFRETELPGFTGDTRSLLTAVGANPELQRLRARRNAIIHLRSDGPAVTVDRQWHDRNDLEQEARRSVKLMFEAFYGNPMV